MTGMNDASLLDDLPDYIALGGFLKASASADGQRRLLYMEASNEVSDYQNEMVLQKALHDSSDYFLRHGNIDLDHFSILGPNGPGRADYMSYEIGTPCEVSMHGKTTFVKAELNRSKGSGDGGLLCKNANMVWDSMTRQSPPARWYPSVGGAVMAKGIRIDPVTQRRIGVIEKVRWNNIGLTRTPVNPSVPEASAIPIGVFAKALGGFVMAKTLTAGYGTDSATLTGGASLRKQSLHGVPISYWAWREGISKSIRDGKVAANPGARELVAHSMKTYSLSAADASEHVEHFLTDLGTGLNKRRQAQ
jgi:hypothetical protein